MLSDKISESFTLYKIKDNFCTQSGSESTTRQRLQDRFDNECPCSFKSLEREVNNTSVTASERRWTSLNLSSVSLPPIHPRRVLRSGANKLSQTLNNVRTKFGTFSQKFRSSTRRRYPLKNDSPNSPLTPQTRSRHLLGRTPTKLYSPFGIESPYHRNVRSGSSKDKENGRYTPRRRNSTRSGCYSTSCRNKVQDGKPFSVYSPHQKFDSDVEEARIGIWEFDQTANNIVRRSLRH